MRIKDGNKLPNIKAVASLFMILLFATVGLSLIAPSQSELFSAAFEIFLIAGIWFIYSFAEKLNIAETFKLRRPSVRNR